jgi:transposase
MLRTHDRETAPQTTRKPYPRDVGDDEWAFVAPYLTLMSEEAPQREHCLREIFNGLRWIVRTSTQWDMKRGTPQPHLQLTKTRTAASGGVSGLSYKGVRL